LIANIWADGTSEIQEFSKKHQISFVDIAVDLSTAGATNMPYDGHPSAQTHSVYAQRLLKILE